MRATNAFVLAAMLIFVAAPAYGEKPVSKPGPGEQERPAVSEAEPSDEELLKRLRAVIESLKGQPLEPGCLEG